MQSEPIMIDGWHNTAFLALFQPTPQKPQCCHAWRMDNLGIRYRLVNGQRAAVSGRKRRVCGACGLTQERCAKQWRTTKGVVA